MRDGTRCLKGGSVFNDKLGGHRINAAELAECQVGMAERRDGYCSATDAGAACIGVVGGDGECAGAALDQRGGAYDGASAAKAIGGSAIHNNAVGFQVTFECDGFLGAGGIKQHVITCDENLGGGCGIVGCCKVFRLGKVPDGALVAVPNNGGCLTDVGDGEVQVMVRIGK
ncbi:MAG: hypothetical protein BWY72_00987 [Bacteroidetes bacterium ADurb.Bin416]|nr:MAG: hypothetical protein BWY72_00987 [Bacteroidetes bacterium ADurb.Bin416]